MYKFIGKVKIFGVEFNVYEFCNSYIYINEERKIFKRFDLK